MVTIRESALQGGDGGMIFSIRGDYILILVATVPTVPTVAPDRTITIINNLPPPAGCQLIAAETHLHNLQNG